MNNEQDLDNTNDQQIKTDNDIIKELEREGKLKKSVMKGGVVDEYENENLGRDKYNSERFRFNCSKPRLSLFLY